MIVLEGADCLGKTTAARKLVELWEGSQYRHMTKPGPGVDHTVYYTQNYEPKIVQDRYHLGLMAYGLLERAYPVHITLDEFADVLKWMRELKVLTLIFFTSNEKIITDQFGSKDEMYRLEQVLRVNAYYRMMAHATLLGQPFASLALNIADGYPSNSDLKQVLSFKETM